jgi:hypothetical protein
MYITYVYQQRNIRDRILKNIIDYVNQPDWSRRNISPHRKRTRGHEQNFSFGSSRRSLSLLPLSQRGPEHSFSPALPGAPVSARPTPSLPRAPHPDSTLVPHPARPRPPHRADRGSSAPLSAQGSRRGGGPARGRGRVGAACAWRQGVPSWISQESVKPWWLWPKGKV